MKEIKKLRKLLEELKCSGLSYDGALDDLDAIEEKIELLNAANTSEYYEGKANGMELMAQIIFGKEE